MKNLRHPLFGWIIAGLATYTAYRLDIFWVTMIAGIFVWIAFTESLESDDD